MNLDFIAGAFGFLMTILILSYLIGDNPAFRLAVFAFVGVAAGYVAAVALRQVLLPSLVGPLITGSPATRALMAVPLLLSGMMLMKGWPSLSRLGAPAMGMLVGVSSAVAILGALRGTLFPQVGATMYAARSTDISLFEAALVLLGVVSSLAYFQFGARVRADGLNARPRIVELIAAVGSVFVAATLGTLFAGVYSASLTALIERLHFLLEFVGLA